MALKLHSPPKLIGSKEPEKLQTKKEIPSCEILFFHNPKPNADSSS
jgi:hypothetical protein